MSKLPTLSLSYQLYTIGIGVPTFETISVASASLGFHLFTVFPLTMIRTASPCEVLCFSSFTSWCVVSRCFGERSWCMKTFSRPLLFPFRFFDLRRIFSFWTSVAKVSLIGLGFSVLSKGRLQSLLSRSLIPHHSSAHVASLPSYPL